MKYLEVQHIPPEDNSILKSITVTLYPKQTEEWDSRSTSLEVNTYQNSQHPILSYINMHTGNPVTG